MSLTLASAIAKAKNLLSDPGVWLALLEIQINNPSATVMRIVLNTENIIWDAQTWTAFPFTLDESKQTADGSIQGLAIRVSNVGRVVQQYVEEADGASGSIVILRIVYSENLELDAVLEEIFEVKSTCCTEELVDDSVMMWVIFELGTENLFARRFPQDVYARQTCRRDFKSAKCGYSGIETLCDKTLGRCIELGNQARFGNCPGIPGEGFDLDATAISTAE
jgi:phage-related protein